MAQSHVVSGEWVSSIARLPTSQQPLDHTLVQKPPIYVPPGPDMALVSEEDIPVPPSRPPYSASLPSAS